MLIIHSEKNATFTKYTNKYCPKNAWVILDSGDSDCKDNLADVMEDLGTEFVVKENEDKHEKQDKEDNSLDSPNYNQPHAIVQKSNSAGDTDVQNKCLFKKINLFDRVYKLHKDPK